MTSDQIKAHRDKAYNATVVSLRMANPDLAVFRIKPDFAIHEHLPGQYTTLGLGYWEPRCCGCREEVVAADHLDKLVRRAYSISSSVVDDRGRLFPTTQNEWLEFYIVLVRDSDKEQAPALTPRLWMLKEGDRLWVGEKIVGHYTADRVKPDDAVVFLSTGTGEAPHNYMLWELLTRGHRGPILAACCCRYKADLGYQQIQDELVMRYPNYRYLPLTTRENPTSKKVYIQDVLSGGDLEYHLGRPLDQATTHVYLCGNPAMIGVPKIDRQTHERTWPHARGMVQLLEERGFTLDQPSHKVHGNIHVEEYW